MNDEKKNLLNLYLEQQKSPQNLEDISLAEFKSILKKWLEFDNFIKKAKVAIKEKTMAQKKLAEVITSYMDKYDIEDINTSEGKIKFKKSVGKTPVSQKKIKETINEYFKDNEPIRTGILTKIYENRSPVERMSLRRLKIS
jgi:Family of unknown function (DUF5760)